jgi:hypothetical protein
LAELAAPLLEQFGRLREAEFFDARFDALRRLVAQQGHKLRALVRPEGRSLPGSGCAAARAGDRSSFVRLRRSRTITRAHAPLPGGVSRQLTMN